MSWNILELGERLFRAARSHTGRKVLSSVGGAPLIVPQSFVPIILSNWKLTVDSRVNFYKPSIFVVNGPYLSPAHYSKCIQVKVSRAQIARWQFCYPAESHLNNDLSSSKRYARDKTLYSGDVSCFIRQLRTVQSRIFPNHLQKSLACESFDVRRYQVTDQDSEREDQTLPQTHFCSAWKIFEIAQTDIWWFQCLSRFYGLLYIVYHLDNILGRTFLQI